MSGHNIRRQAVNPSLKSRIARGAKAAGYSKAQAGLLQWLMEHYLQEVCRGSRALFCDNLRCHWTTVTRVLDGKYGGDVRAFFRRVATLRRKCACAPNGGVLIETCVTREIKKVMDLALHRNAVTMIWGDPGRSKTATARDWTAEHHDQAVYVETPTIGGLPELMRRILEAAGRERDFSYHLAKTSNAAARALSERVLVLDEVARLMRSRSQVKQLDWLRELHDRHDVGIVFVATRDFVSELDGGALAKYLEQLVGRIADRLHIPHGVSWQEARELAQGIRRDADQELITVCWEIANAKGGDVRVLLEQIAPDAILLARSDGREVSAADFAAVWKDYKGENRLPVK